jgi:hypothetical protein
MISLKCLSYMSFSFMFNISSKDEKYTVKNSWVPIFVGKLSFYTSSEVPFRGIFVKLFIFPTVHGIFVKLFIFPTVHGIFVKLFIFPTVHGIFVKLFIFPTVLYKYTMYRGENK